MLPPESLPSARGEPPPATAAASPLLDPPGERVGSCGLTDRPEDRAVLLHRRLGEHDRARRAHPRDDRGVGLRHPFATLLVAAGTRQPGDVDPVLDRDRKAVQRTDRTVTFPDAIEHVGARQRIFVVPRRHTVGDLVHRAQPLERRLDCPARGLRIRHVAIMPRGGRVAARRALVARYRAMDENTFSALALIALVAVIAPLLSEAIRGRIPSVVIEIALGIAIGPYALELAKVTPVVDALSVAGLTFLFFMAGYEIDMRRIRGRPLRLATLGWVGSLAIALAIAAVLYFVGFTLSTLLIALALTTTALGTLLPMLEDNHEMGTRFGAFVLAIGGAGEFFPIVAVAVLLSGRNPFGTAILLVAFIALSAAAIAIAMRPIPAPVEALLGRTLDTSSQLPVRIAVLIVLGLVLGREPASASTSCSARSRPGSSCGSPTRARTRT